MRMPTPANPSWVRASKGVQLSTMRMIRDQAFSIVLIYEAGSEAPANASRVLVFDWDAGMAQLTPFPPDWKGMTEAELLALRELAIQGPPSK